MYYTFLSHKVVFYVSDLYVEFMLMLDANIVHWAHWITKNNNWLTWLVRVIKKRWQFYEQKKKKNAKYMFSNLNSTNPPKWKSKVLWNILSCSILWIGDILLVKDQQNNSLSWISLKGLSLTRIKHFCSSKAFTSKSY